MISDQGSKSAAAAVSGRCFGKPFNGQFVYRIFLLLVFFCDRCMQFNSLIIRRWRIRMWAFPWRYAYGALVLATWNASNSTIVSLLFPFLMKEKPNNTKRKSPATENERPLCEEIHQEIMGKTHYAPGLWLIYSFVPARGSGRLARVGLGSWCDSCIV